jgi:hypothetical protein
LLAQRLLERLLLLQELSSSGNCSGAIVERSA